MNTFEDGAERNKALGIWGGIAAAGATVGLIAGGLLTRYVGWQYIFYINVPIGAAALALAPRLVPDSQLATVRRRFDALGAIVGTGGLVLLVDAIADAPRYGWGATRTIAVLAGSVALLVAFAGIESRAEEPLLPPSVFRLRTLAGANIAGLLSGASFFAFVFVGTLYMQQVLRYSALEAGIAWLAASLSSMALSGLSQTLVTRRGAQLVMATGMIMIAAGVIWASQVPVHGHFLANLAVPMVIAGAGTAFAFVSISIAALTGVPEHQAGLASGLLNTSRQFGGALGIAIASSVTTGHTSALLHAGDSVPTALTGGFQRALWVLGAIALLALPAIFALVRGDRGSDTIGGTAIREARTAVAGTN
jgi:MFS family permease